MTWAGGSTDILPSHPFSISPIRPPFLRCCYCCCALLRRLGRSSARHGCVRRGREGLTAPAAGGCYHSTLFLGVCVPGRVAHGRGGGDHGLRVGRAILRGGVCRSLVTWGTMDGIARGRPRVGCDSLSIPSQPRPPFTFFLLLPCVARSLTHPPPPTATATAVLSAACCCLSVVAGAIYRK